MLDIKGLETMLQHLEAEPTINDILHAHVSVIPADGTVETDEWMKLFMECVHYGREIISHMERCSKYPNGERWCPPLPRIKIRVLNVAG